MAEVATPARAKGTEPEGAHTQAEASQKVREMFTQIAPRYDLLNHVLSFQLDRLWRARAVHCLRPILRGHLPLVLDLCCGTGDLAMAMARRFTPRVIGADFVLPMLMRAKEKSAALGGKNVVQLGRPKFVAADALRLPFADQCFDLVTSAFGFRNLANYEAGLREIHRVLKPGGTIAILDFSEPRDGLVGDVYRWYFSKVLPRIGGFLSGDSSAYSYLPKSVARFFRPPELAALMASLAYESVAYQVWTFGTVALHTGIRPPR